MSPMEASTNWGVGTVVMKNCEPLVLGPVKQCLRRSIDRIITRDTSTSINKWQKLDKDKPALAMDRRPGLVCL